MNKFNKPADFVKPFQDGKNETHPAPNVLIPPSQFEKPFISTPTSKELLDIKKEMTELQKENERLKLSSQKISQRSEDTAFALQANFAEELIKRQAAEILELTKFREAHQLAESEWEKKRQKMETLHHETTSKLTVNYRRELEDLKNQNYKLKTELDTVKDQSERDKSSLKERLHLVEQESREAAQTLEDQLVDCRARSQTKLIELEKSLRSKDVSLEEKSKTIEKLKTYIGEVQELNKPTLAWKTEKETVENQLKISVAESEKIKSEMDLLSVRFNALNDLISLQEQEIAKSKSRGFDKTKQHSLLITRWREKVFMLLVQQQSSKITHQKEMKTLKSQIYQLEDQLSSTLSQVGILEHSLKEKLAQLEMEQKHRQRVEKELCDAHRIAVCLDDQSRNDLSIMSQFALFVERSMTAYEKSMKILDEKSNHLKQLNERVSFASSRINLLKNQFLRRTAMDIMNTNNNADDCMPQVDSKPAQSYRHGEEHIHQELESVIRERDCLADQVANDAIIWTEKVSQMRASYFEEINSLKKTIEDLEYKNQQKAKMCESLKEELTSKTEDLKENEETVLKLQADIARHEKGIENVLLEQRLADEANYTKKLSDVEKNLNQSKREYAKAVVNLRQIERTHKRELDRANELLHTTETHLTHQVNSLTQRVRSLEKERNIMVATLRQEGLISQLRAERGEPYVLLEDVIIEDNNSVRDKKEEEISENLETVEDVLEDLKSLTEAVMGSNTDDECDM